MFDRHTWNLVNMLDKEWYTQNAAQYISSYLTNRQKKFPINRNFSTRENIFPGLVSQGSLLGPGLFNIFINNLILFVSNSYLSKYGDDNILHAFSYNLEEI